MGSARWRADEDAEMMSSETAGNHTRLDKRFRSIRSAVTHRRARSAVRAIIPCEITQYRHHTMSTSFPMWVRSRANPNPTMAASVTRIRCRGSANPTSARYPGMQMAATCMWSISAKQLWFAMPQSHFSLIEQGSLYRASRAANTQREEAIALL